MSIKGTKKITIIDLANHLGISKSTVSRALRDSSEISDKTKKKVKKLAAKWNFQPSLQARSLRGDNSMILGLIVPKIAHTYFSSAITGVQDTVRQYGYSVFVCESDESFEKEKRAISELSAANAAGIIISLSAQSKNGSHLQYLLKQNIPVIFFDRVCESTESSKVIIDHKKAAYNATKHLILADCKNIVHLSGPQNLSITKSRIAGFKNALEEVFIPFSMDNVFEIGYKPERVVDIIHKLIELKYDGISCFNDEVAVRTIQELKKLKIQIPEQIKIIGFNNEKITEIIDPPLTSIEHPAYELGKKAAGLFLNHAQNKGKIKHSTIELETNLIKRRSTENRI